MIIIRNTLDFLSVLHINFDSRHTQSVSICNNNKSLYNRKLKRNSLFNNSSVAVDIINELQQQYKE